MKWAVKVGDKWLKRAANATWSRDRGRDLVDDLEEATLWAQPGHAKNAANHAAVSGRTVKGGTEVLVVRIELVPTIDVVRHVIKKPY